MWWRLVELAAELAVAEVVGVGGLLSRSGMLSLFQMKIIHLVGEVY